MQVAEQPNEAGLVGLEGDERAVRSGLFNYQPQRALGIRFGFIHVTADNHLVSTNIIHF